MRRGSRLAWVLLLTTTGGFTGLRPSRADDPPPPERKPVAPAAETGPADDGVESRVMLAVLRATGRLMLRYLEEKQDPEKAAAYEDVFRALGGMLTRLDRGDPRGMAAAGMKAMLDLLPSMRSPKRAEVMRTVLMTLATSTAGELQGDVASGPRGARSDVGETPHGLAHALLGGLAEGLLDEVSAWAMGGAQIDSGRLAADAIRVTAVKPGSKAALRGLAAGDTIVLFGDAPASWRSLLAVSRTLRRGGEFPRLTVLRDGKRVELGVAPAAAPPGDPPPPTDRH